MRIWPRAFLSPQSEAWRKKVESDIDSNTSDLSKIQGITTSLSSGLAALRGRFASDPTPQRGVVALNGNGGTTLTGSVTFPNAFSTPPVVVAAPAGHSTTDTGTSGTGVSSLVDWGNFSVYNVSESGFSMAFSRASGTFSASNFYFVTWMALPS